MTNCLVEILVLFLGLSVALSACQQVPTVVTTENKTILVNEPSVRKLVTEETVLVDARSPFEFGLSHIPGSINLQWQDFSIPGSPNQGFLDLDKFKLARRLAFVGIDPETPVLILGLGAKGDGAEGRLAWMFKFLGISKVTTASYDLMRAQMTQVNSHQPAPATNLETYT
jgi:thiosulfate/3-mercaptopyruvate sulfurtransferase